MASKSADAGHAAGNARLTTCSPLLSLRTERGMSRTEVITRAREVEPAFPSTYPGLQRIEARGTDNYWYIQALATVYSIDPATVATLARSTQSAYAATPKRPKII
jgi:hypothetical protein